MNLTRLGSSVRHYGKSKGWTDKVSSRFLTLANSIRRSRNSSPWILATISTFSYPKRQLNSCLTQTLAKTWKESTYQLFNYEKMLKFAHCGLNDENFAYLGEYREQRERDERKIDDLVHLPLRHHRLLKSVLPRMLGSSMLSRNKVKNRSRDRSDRNGIEFSRLLLSRLPHLPISIIYMWITRRYILFTCACLVLPNLPFCAFGHVGYNCI